MARKKRPEVQERDLEGFKLIEAVAQLLKRLHDDGCARDKAGNRNHLNLMRMGTRFARPTLLMVLRTNRKLEFSDPVARTAKLLREWRAPTANRSRRCVNGPTA